MARQRPHPPTHAPTRADPPGCATLARPLAFAMPIARAGPTDAYLPDGVVAAVRALRVCLAQRCAYVCASVARGRVRAGCLVPVPGARVFVPAYPFALVAPRHSGPEATRATAAVVRIGTADRHLFYLNPQSFGGVRFTPPITLLGHGSCQCLEIYGLRGRPAPPPAYLRFQKFGWRVCSIRRPPAGFPNLRLILVERRYSLCGLAHGEVPWPPYLWA